MFRDDFHQGLDFEKWETSFVGWGLRTLATTGQQQWYTDPDQPLGTLAHQQIGSAFYLVADHSPDPTQTGGLPYTSGMLTTERSYHFRYGKVSVRCWCPRGRGLWPAIWLVPSDGGDHLPEIDIMEVLGHDTRTVYQSGQHQTSGDVLPILGDNRTGAVDAADGWHDYGLHWDKEEIIWSIDQRETQRVRNFAHEPHHLIINLAVGGFWPGNPDSGTRFPAYMGLNYVSIDTL